jgi:hypothetical protein
MSISPGFGTHPGTLVVCHILLGLLGLIMELVYRIYTVARSLIVPGSFRDIVPMVFWDIIPTGNPASANVSL